MDDFDISDIGDGAGLDEPLSLDDVSGDTQISHSPLHLGGSSETEEPEPKAEVKVEPPAPVAEKVVGKVAEKVISSERITGVRTFFTKLHAGAIDFLDGQITEWLKKNPDISIKRTNAVTGMVQGKKSEPNIIITVWY